MEEIKKITSDASPLEVARYAIEVLDSKKAHDIKLLHVEKQTIIADYFIIATGTSSTQIKALCDEVEFRLTECGIGPGHIEGHRGDNWILMDYGSVIIHVFASDMREFYQIEKLYDGACETDFNEVEIAAE